MPPPFVHNSREHSNEEGSEAVLAVRREIGPFAFFGLLVGVGLSLFAAGAFMLRGGYREAGEAAVLVRVVAAFLLSGPLAGLTAGLLYPLARWRVGSAVIGGLTMIPIMAALAVATAGGIDWRSLDEIQYRPSFWVAQSACS